MKLNRRSTLLALGTMAVGSGTALATGAFSSLSANRTVTINTASDADAVLSLKLDDEYNGLNDEGTNVILLDFSQLNENAVTTFVGALKIGNNGSQEVGVTIKAGGDVLRFSGVPENLDPDESEFVTIIVNLKDSTDAAPEEITISAET